MDVNRAQRVLLLDNYDSYTFNLFQLLAEVNGVPPVVLHNDEVDWALLEPLLRGGSFDCVVISPGPGTPECATDVGVCLSALKELPHLPIFGVCLGHQALGYANGAKVVHAPEPVHGRVSQHSSGGSAGVAQIRHGGHPLFKNIPSGAEYQVVRYHSLVVDEATLPNSLMPIAWTADSAPPQLTDVLMAIAHVSRPHYGVQFHPESVSTLYGATLIRNFLCLAQSFHLEHKLFKSQTDEQEMNALGRFLSEKSCNSLPRPWGGLGAFRSYQQQAQSAAMFVDSTSQPAHTSKEGTSLMWRQISHTTTEAGGSEALFWSLFGQGDATDTFWLDSATTAMKRARFSFMGGRQGPLWERLTYRLFTSQEEPDEGEKMGILTVETASGQVDQKTLSNGFFDFLNNRICDHHVINPEAKKDLPFDFWGGFVGYLGYEMRSECGSRATVPGALTPDAAFFFTDRLLAVDHETNQIFLLTLYKSEAAAMSWISSTEAAIGALCEMHRTRTLSGSSNNASSQCTSSSSLPQDTPTAKFEQHEIHFVPRRDKAGYLDDVRSCKQLINDGETYEVCLTNKLKCSPVPVDPKELYSTLRKVNPAPYAAWLNFGPSSSSKCEPSADLTINGLDKLVIACSSPERFLRLDQSNSLEAKPIKGTAKRILDDSEADNAVAEALQTCVKERAENLMIVDLLRNDLGRVCEVGSVCVPQLIQLESFATVHQLVSTIHGQRRPGVSSVECVKAAFPGGSMTGAPKIRTMEIIERLEGKARGIYSGCIGYFSVNDTFDMNIVIRTAIFHNNEITIGAGGAVVALSEPEAEYEEMMLKAERLKTAILAEATGKGFMGAGYNN